MSMLSLDFLALLAGLTLAYYLLPLRARKWALLVGSVAYWMLCGWQGALYLAGEAALTWLCALGMARVKRPGGRRVLLAGALAAILGAMVLIKERERLPWPGGSIWPWTMPLGLSYLTFQSAGYLLDVYRGKIPAERSYPKVLLFCGFFPQLAQGPIAPWKQLAPQLDEPHRLEPERFVAGVILMAWGYFKKLVIADRVMPLALEAAAGYEALPGWAILLAVTAYTVALYADFSGGIDMARGAAALWGVRLEENFRRPFFAVSVADFWRRWHITLGAWFRTYVLYPLATSRAGVGLGRLGKRLLGPKAGRALPGAVAAFLVFVLIGLWHGLYWNALLYGAWFGLLTALAMLLEEPFKRAKRWLGVTKETRWFRAFGRVRTWLAVLLAQFFACASSPRAAFGMLGRAVTAFGQGSLSGLAPLDASEAIVAMAALAILLAVDVWCEKRGSLAECLAAAPLYARWPALLALLLITLIFGRYGAGYDAAAFLYAGF